MPVSAVAAQSKCNTPAFFAFRSAAQSFIMARVWVRLCADLNDEEEAVMKVWLGAAFVATALAFAAPAIAGSTGVAQTKAQAAATSAATDLGARRVSRRYAYRAYTPAYSPAYYARPTYYRPYPYGVPVPFFLGFAYLPYW